MKKKTSRRLLAFILASMFMSNLALPAIACGPDFDTATMVSSLHPDLPLSKFAAGNLGIIQPSWAKSYLIVAYRYLTKNPLDPEEQSSIIALWHRRLHNASLYVYDYDYDFASEFFKLRAKVLKLKLEKWASKYDYQYSDLITDSAFEVARNTLAELIKKYGMQSAVVRDWLKTQDNLFGVNSSKTQVAVKPDPSIADLFVRACREYQVAASLFYSNDADNAKSAFEKLAKEGFANFTELAWYMTARCAVNQAIEANSPDSYKAAFALLDNLKDKFPKGKYKADIGDLYQKLLYESKPETRSIDYLAKEILKPHASRFGNMVGDFTFLIDDDPNTKDSDTTKSDLCDWVRTVQQPDPYFFMGSDDEKKKAEEEQKTKAKHALEKWRSTHSLPWLVAALSTNHLSRKATPDLFKAAEQVDTASPAYLSASAYLIGAFIEERKKTEAQKKIAFCLSLKNLPPSARNVFLTQRIAVSKSLTEYLKSISQNPTTISPSTYSADLPRNWESVERLSHFHSEDCTVTNLQVTQIDANLPLSRWLEWARDKSVPKALHNRLLQTTWVRALILGKDSGLDDDLAAAYPNIGKYMPAFKNASAGPEKKFKMAKLILHNVGMTPYLGGDIERHNQAIDEFDYYNANFWLPYKTGSLKKINEEENPEYPVTDVAETYMLSKVLNEATAKPASKVQIAKFLSSAELKDSKNERAEILKNHPSKFLGDAVIEWSKSHPKDPDVPELLYKVCRLPKWTGVTALGSNYSHQAYNILHSKYPKNSWTDKAVCWY